MKLVLLGGGEGEKEKKEVLSKSVFRTPIINGELPSEQDKAMDKCK